VSRELNPETPTKTGSPWLDADGGRTSDRDVRPPSASSHGLPVFVGVSGFSSRLTVRCS